MNYQILGKIITEAETPCAQLGKFLRYIDFPREIAKKLQLAELPLRNRQLKGFLHLFIHTIYPNCGTDDLNDVLVSFFLYDAVSKIEWDQRDAIMFYIDQAHGCKGSNSLVEMAISYTFPNIPSRVEPFTANFRLSLGAHSKVEEIFVVS